GLALDQDRDRRRGGAFHQAEDVGHRWAGADDLREAVAPREIATKDAHLCTQALFRGLHVLVETRVLDRDGDAAGESVEEGQIVIAEAAAATAIHHLDDADDAVTRAKRCREQAPGAHARLPVDLGIEARIGVRVVDPKRTAVAHDRAGDAVLDRYAQAAQPRGRVGILLRDVRED